MYSFDIQLKKLQAAIIEDNNVKARYLADGHSNYQKSQDVHGHLLSARAHLLYANNNHARLKAAIRVFEEIETLVKGLKPVNVLQLTLTPGQFTFGEVEGRFDPTPFKRLISRYFKEVNMVGIIEPGFYPRLTMNSSRGTVSFHVHAIAWGISPVALRTIAVPFKKNHLSHFVNRPSAYVQSVPVEDVPKVLSYQYKPPNMGYEVYAAQMEAVDPETGEILCWLAENSRSRKRSLRKGERVRVDNAIKDLTFDRLLVGTGEGRGMVKRICHDLLRDFRARSR